MAPHDSVPSRVGLTTTQTAALDAALQEFATYGFQRTSMEGVARRAHLSRATLYTHWGSKDELFRSLVRRLHDDRLQAMRQAAESTDGKRFEHRLLAVLEARFVPWVELTSASTHAAELYEVHGRRCGDLAQDALARSERLLVRLVRDGVEAGEVDLAPSGLTAAQAARALLDAAHGAKGEDPSRAVPAEFGRRLRRVVALLSGGLVTSPVASATKDRFS